MADAKTIRFDLTKKEQKEDGSVLGFTFRLGEFGVGITEHWRSMDELYGDGTCIVIPPRIWALALPWIIEQSKS